MKKVVSLLLALLLVLSLAACGEQKTPDNSDPGTENTLNYPTSPITLYCPWAAGGSSDLMCRQISSLLGKYADNAIVNVVNREGGNGAVCLGEIAQASGNDDGYTMSFASDATLSINPYGTKREDLPEWARSVIENQQRLLHNSFIPMTEELVLKIYQDLY